jgi:hypothetical protein
MAQMVCLCGAFSFFACKLVDVALYVVSPSLMCCPRSCHVDLAQSLSASL